MVSVTACVLYPYDRRPSSLHIDFSILVNKSLLGLCTHNFPCTLTVDVVAVCSTVIASFLGSGNISLSLCEVSFFLSAPSETM